MHCTGPRAGLYRGVLTALLALVGWGGAQAAGVYQGTLGTQAVVLKLNGPDDSYYFYARTGVDIPLSVGGSDGAISLTETPASWDAGPDGSYTRVTGRLSLMREGNTLKGSWQSPDGRRRLPVRLSPVKVATGPLALPASPGLLKLRAEDAATFLKLNHALLPAGRKHGLEWLREPLSGLSYPRLPGQTGNAVLQDRLLRFAQSALDCQGQLGTKGDPGQPAWDQTTSVTYLSPRLLSLSETVSYFCGGAHPDAYTEGLMLDRASGRALKVRDLWPRLTLRALNRLYLAGYPKTADPECRDALRLPGVDSASDPTAYAAFLTPGGLSLWPTFLPHVVLACAETVTVPYTKLAPLAGPLAPRR